MRIDELKDVASEPHQFNVYMVTNLTTLTQNVANRLKNTFCNSKHVCNSVPFMDIMLTDVSHTSIAFVFLRKPSS